MLSYLELLELANGDIVLQGSEGDDKPLVTIRFSDEARSHITGSALELARVMIQAGLEAVAGIEEAEVLDDDEELPAELSSRTVH